jgi:hypothetical protein
MVGAHSYGMLGRWVRPPDAPDSERQKLYKDVGFDTVNELSENCFIFCIKRYFL